MPKKKPVNPFYVVLVLAGLAFGLTALGYFIMSARATYDPIGSRAEMDQAGGLMAVMDRYGVKIMIVELIGLAVATVLAIGTDGFWTRLHESRHTTNAGPAKESNSEN